MAHKMTEYADHRGGLAESMATLTKVNTVAELKAHLSGNEFFDAETVIVEPYMDRPDDRKGWPVTCLVTAVWRGGERGVIGMTNGMPQPDYRSCETSGSGHSN